MQMTSGQKAALTRKRRAAGRKAAATRRRRAAARRAAATRALNRKLARGEEIVEMTPREKRAVAAEGHR